MSKFKFLKNFFFNYPSLFYALFFLLGISFFFYSKLIFLLCFIFAIDKKKFFVSIFVFLFAYFYSFYFFSDLKKIDKPLQGISHFKISSVKEVNNFKSKYYQYLGTIKTLETSDHTYNNIQATISSKKLLSPMYYYSIDGTLFPTENFSYYIKTKKNWQKEEKKFSLAKIRFNLKKRFYKYLKKNIKDTDSVNFLHTLITGENNHKFLSFCFSKIGLQHVLAISGFHFNIFTMFFSFLLTLFFPKRFVIYLLLILVNLYFLFLGPLISVQRAYLMIQMALIAQIFNKKYLALNALGISLIIILLFNPLSFKNIGFQLSYLCTFAILLIYPIIDALTTKVIKKRSLQEINKLSYISKIGLKILEYLRQNISLGISVNIMILPVLLYSFHKFSTLSLIYNLFIPFLVGILLMMVMIGLVFHFVPLISFLINNVTAFSTKIVLKMIISTPSSLEYYLRLKNINFEFVIIYLVFIVFSFIYLRNFMKKDELPTYCNFL